MSVVSGPGVAPVATSQQELVVDKHVSYIQSLDKASCCAEAKLTALAHSLPAQG